MTGIKEMHNTLFELEKMLTKYASGLHRNEAMPRLELYLISEVQSNVHKSITGINRIIEFHNWLEENTRPP